MDHESVYNAGLANGTISKEGDTNGITCEENKLYNAKTNQVTNLCCNIVRYYMNDYRNWDMVSIRCRIHKDTPSIALTGEWWGVFCEYLRKIDRVIMVPLCVDFPDTIVRVRRFFVMDFNWGEQCNDALLFGNEGTIESQQYPYNYPNNQECQWTIHAGENMVRPENARIKLLNYCSYSWPWYFENSPVCMLVYTCVFFSGGQL